MGGAKGLANANVDGFFFDDGWSDKANPVPPWAPASYRQCDMAVGGGASEEDFYCTEDMGLTSSDVKDIRGNWTDTMAAVYQHVDDNKGFVFQQLASRAASIDLSDPRPKCMAYVEESYVSIILHPLYTLYTPL